MSRPEGAKEPRRLAIIFNPAAGRPGERFLRKTLRELDAQSVIYTVAPTLAAGDAQRLAEEACHGPLPPDAVVAAGGDGTIQEVVNGIKGADVALGIIPLGTANVLAREIGLTFAPDAIARTLAQGEPRKIHLGQIGERRFVMMAGIGFDAESVRRVNGHVKAIFGRAAYGLAAIEELLFGAHPVIEITANGVAHSASWLIVGNGHYYAGGFSVTRGACLSDPSLTACLFQSPRRGDLLRYVGSAVMGHHDRLDDVTFLKTESLHVSGPEDMVVQADGELVGHLPVTISLAPETLDLIHPPAAAESKKPR